MAARRDPRDAAPLDPAADAEALGTAAGFGALNGVLKVYAGHWQTVGVLLRVVPATLVVRCLRVAARQDDRRLDAGAEPVSLDLPRRGGLLTTATLDPAAGEVISGASRLVAGTMRLVLLNFGLLAGAEIAGVSLDRRSPNQAQNTLGDWLRGSGS